jgi:hypothetical protein
MAIAIVIRSGQGNHVHSGWGRARVSVKVGALVRKAKIVRNERLVLIEI